MPKGVLLSHMAFLSGFNTTATFGFDVSKDDVEISYLPMAHAYELFVNMKVLYAGASSGFFGGNILKLTEDMAILKPTLVPMVPRLLTKLYDGF